MVWRRAIDDLEFLSGMLAIPSPAGHEDEIAAYLVRHMSGLGFQAWRDEVGNAVGAVGSPDASRVILLLGHMDTAPGYIPVRRDGDALYGRGAVDAKGPLAAFILAAAQVAPDLGNARLMVVGAVQEEGPSLGARHLARTMPTPYCCIIGEPSGSDAITLGYKGAQPVDYSLTLPTGHSAGPRAGPPAEAAVAFWGRLKALANAFNQGKARAFETLDVTLRSIQTGSDGLQDRVEMSIGVRLPPGFDVDALRHEIRTWAEGARLQFDDWEPPFVADKNTPPVRALLQAIREHGAKPRFKLKTGTSDMNIVGPAWGCPIVAHGPGDSSLDHTPKERIMISEFRTGVEVLARALRILAADG